VLVCLGLLSRVYSETSFLYIRMDGFCNISEFEISCQLVTGVLYFVLYFDP
jgi:hypothetical protein